MHMQVLTRIRQENIITAEKQPVREVENGLCNIL